MPHSRSAVLTSFLFSILLHAIAADPYQASAATAAANGIRCIRLNRPPYVYCDLPGDPVPPVTAQNGDFVARLPSPPTDEGTTVSTPVEAFEELATRRTPLPPPEVFTETTPLATDFDASSLAPVTSAPSTSLPPTTATPEEETVAPDPIEELAEPPPRPHSGPSILEELFIDTLTGVAGKPSPSDLYEDILSSSNHRLQHLCQRFLPLAHRYCHREWTHPAYVAQCRGYFQDCRRLLPRVDPLTEASRNYQMSVRYGNRMLPFQTEPNKYV